MNRAYLAFKKSAKGGAGGWLLASFVVAALIAAPVVALGSIAAQGSGDLWPHLLAYVFPSALRDTILLLGGVGILVMAIGTGLAWLLTAYDFPGRRLFGWALLLPLAMPTYVIAFAYLDILHPIGPIQSTIRGLLGITNPQDLPFPEIRSLGGCILLFAFVLYPYVLLSTRAIFAMQAGTLIEVSRTLGAGRARVFFSVALPLARPAVVVGTSLAMMETLNDIGASEFLGVNTLTVSIYSTWINRSNLAGAAQIALFMLALVALVVIVERWARRRQRYVSHGHKATKLPAQTLTGWQALLAILACGVPVLVGFLLPAAHLISETAKRVQFAGISAQIGWEIANTLLVASIATLVTLVLALSVTYAARLQPGRLTSASLRIASFGYAVPGTVLAIGLLIPLAAFDNAISSASQAMFGISTGLILSASGVALVYAYSARFLAVAAGGVEAGFGKVSPSLDNAARALGQTRSGTLVHIHLPLLRPALAAAALLVFVDCMKELPATLLLRPLNFETLATHLYGEAARGTYEDGSIAALCIVLFGLLPVILLARVSSGASGAAYVTASRSPPDQLTEFILPVEAIAKLPVAPPMRPAQITMPLKTSEFR